jgi:hypothetical protein
VSGLPTKTRHPKPLFLEMNGRVYDIPAVEARVARGERPEGCASCEGTGRGGRNAAVSRGFVFGPPECSTCGGTGVVWRDPGLPDFMGFQ